LLRILSAGGANLANLAGIVKRFALLIGSARLTPLRRRGEEAMPGHFTHIYTARRVAEALSRGDAPEWPGGDKIDGALASYKPEDLGRMMVCWPKFTAVGAVGPDLFYFSQDYNGSLLGPRTDDIMLALATYYI
jgi:hypothetical protein